MNRLIRVGASVVAVAVVAGAGFALKAMKQTDARAERLPSAQAVQALGRQPLHFEANEGQTDASVKFLSRGPGYSLFLTQAETVVTLAKHAAGAQPETAVVRMAWAGADPQAKVTGLAPLPGKSNYLMGSDPAQWHRGIASYGKVRYENLYRGVDLVFYGNQRQLEYDFVVAPGANPNAIRLSFSGEDQLSIDAQGNLVIGSGATRFVQNAPVVYQEVGEKRVQVEGAYVKKSAHEVGFELAAYDTGKTLFIDPVLVFSTFLGGSGSDEIHGVAVDGANNIYVAGYTASVNFPTTAGTVSTGCPGCAAYYTSLFVTKLSAAGALVYSTYVGSTNTADKASGIALDASGNAYVVGETYYPGSGPTFPSVNPLTPTANNGGGGFLFKLNATGSALLYSTVFRSGSSAASYGVAVLGSSAFVVGGGAVGSTMFPIWPTAGTYNSLYGTSGSYDTYILKIDTTQSGLTALKYATRIGSGFGYGIAVDGSGNAFITGESQISSNRKVLVAKLDAAGSVVFAKELGGAGDSYGWGIAVDGPGNLYVTGQTAAADFPVTAGAFQTVYGAMIDGFVTKLDPTGATLYSTFLGGAASTDIAHAITVDASGQAYVAGQADSSNFPITANAVQPAKASPNTEAFLSVVNAAGTGLVYSSFLGGSGNTAGGDKGFGVALDSTGAVIVAGQTDSPDFPNTAGSAQGTFGAGSFDGFVTKVSLAGGPGPGPGPGTVPAPPSSVTATAGDAHVTVAWAASADATSYNLYWSNAATVSKATGTLVSNVAAPYFHTGLTNDATYYYVVTAVNGAGESVESPVANAKPVAAGCFIATAAYGSPMASDVRYLRAFRDEFLMTNGPGRLFVSAYYWASPTFAGVIRQHDFLRAAVRTDLAPLVLLSKVVTDEQVVARETADKP
jgi:hypothetical protein